MLRASVGGARDPDAAFLPEEDLVVRIRADIQRYLRITSEPLFARVYRMPHAGVLLEVGHLSLIEGAEARLNSLPGLFISSAGVRGVGIADCVGDARTQAAAAARFADRGKRRVYASAVGR